jgi:7-carboxy-7-deazaguanine synthase
MTVEEVVAAVSPYRCQLVEVTGGEPMLQAAVHGLIAGLLELGMTVLVETSGAVDLSALDPRAIKIMDLKCPASGESERNLWGNIEYLTAHDEVKFVIAGRSDYDWARHVITEHGLERRVNAILMSPVFGRLEPVRLAQWIFSDGLAARFQLQLHKHIWPPGTRGV